MFKSIVWAAEGSENFERAYPLVKQLAQEGDAEVTMVHVVERVEALGAIGPTRRVDEPQIQAELHRRAEELSREGVTASVEIKGEIGVRPAHAVVEVAREKNADLIVAGTRGLGPVAGLLLGTETQRLLHLAPCPVMVIPNKER